MGSSLNKAKQKWNDTHYTQLKVSIDPELATAFKGTCITANRSMASVISEFMVEYCRIGAKQKSSPSYATRQQRRNTVKKLLITMEAVKQAEEAYMENIPENLRQSIRYEAAEESIEALDEAMTILAQAY